MVRDEIEGLGACAPLGTSFPRGNDTSPVAMGAHRVPAPGAAERLVLEPRPLD